MNVKTKITLGTDEKRKALYIVNVQMIGMKWSDLIHLGLDVSLMLLERQWWAYRHASGRAALMDKSKTKTGKQKVQYAMKEVHQASAVGWLYTVSQKTSTFLFF